MSYLPLTASDSPSGPLLGKTAVISGASSGIGAAIARELCRQGAYVVINHPFTSEEERARQILSTLEGPSHSIVVEADISTLRGPRALIQAAVAEFGHIDMLVNNAGISAVSVLDEGKDEEIARIWDSVVAVNGRGTMMLTRAALPHLSQSHTSCAASISQSNPNSNLTESSNNGCSHPGRPRLCESQYSASARQRRESLLTSFYTSRYENLLLHHCHRPTASLRFVSRPTK